MKMGDVKWIKRYFLNESGYAQKERKITFFVFVKC